MDYKTAQKDPKIPFGEIVVPSGDIDTDPFYQPLADSFVRRGFSVSQVDSKFYVWDETHEKDLNLTLEQFGQALSDGAYFKAIRTGVVIPLALYDTPVPEGVPGSVKVIDENTTQQKTFREWADDMSHFDKLDGIDTLVICRYAGKTFDSNDVAPLFSMAQLGQLNILFWREVTNVIKPGNGYVENEVLN